MNKLVKLKPKKVFEFFSHICQIPHGSGNMKAIADYCEDFAKMRNLKVVRDSADNVIIYKNASAGFESSLPVILQGHLDMVCQKTADSDADFEKDPISIYVDGDFVKAKGTTLGADNGIAVAMILSILDSDDIPHPPIEAVFTTDEEIGMLGASALDMSLLSGKIMINIDSEEDDVLTVSCAGGLDFTTSAKPETKISDGTALSLIVKGLAGGHSGVEIDKGRINSNILAGRILNELKKSTHFDIISIFGGDKVNAIPLRTEIAVITNDVERFKAETEAIFEVIKKEISSREPGFNIEIAEISEKCNTALSDSIQEKLIFILNLVPNGIIEMSREIDGLVETSLNLGIFKADKNGVFVTHALRSNKSSAIYALADRLSLLYNSLDFENKTGGYYPPWEFKENSALQDAYRDAYSSVNGTPVKVEAIHAGLECAVFADKIKDLDCIAIGPTLFDVHTVSERMQISSVEKIYKTVTKLLGSLK